LKSERYSIFFGTERYYRWVPANIINANIIKECGGVDGFLGLVREDRE